MKLSDFIGFVAFSLCAASVIVGVLNAAFGSYKAAIVYAICAVANASLAYFELFVRWRS